VSEAASNNLGVWGTASPRDKQTWTNELRAWCAEHLPAFKIPDEFCWCEALPSGGALGKRSRAALRRWWQAQAQGGDHE
jgi:acyl-coenzyme A synthetase/AMP-(fatty) acid ligase